MSGASSTLFYNPLNRLPRFHFSPPPLSKTTGLLRRTTSRTLVSTAFMDKEDNVGSLKQKLVKVFEKSLQLTIPEGLLTDGKTVEALVVASKTKNAKLGDYQCNNAMSLWSLVKGKSPDFKNPRSVGEAIEKNLPPSEMVEKTSVAGPGFVNVVLSAEWMAQSIQEMLIHGIELWAPRLDVKRALVDFSSPNIAKEMHVGHLRSTIIGDTIARMLEFSNVEVLRRNHVGDWGTQFGMLIEFLFEKFPEWEEAGETAIGDLQAFYKQSKEKFDKDPVFKEKAKQAVVLLQGGEEKYKKAWEQICEISRKEFDQVYKRLNVHLEERGESFYNPHIRNVLTKLEGLIEESEGARVIFIDGKQIPLIVVKSDGGYNYATTDLAALWYRLNEEKAEWIIYVTDVGQHLHLDMVFSAARRAGWLSDEKKYPKTSHVGFGLVLGDDGKRFRTRSTEVVRLVDLLDEAKIRSKAALVERGKAAEWTADELEKTAEAVGYGAVKYSDLKNNRLTNYTFNFDQMLSDKGNTAVYLLYAHARICSIIRKSGKDIEDLKKNGRVVLHHEDERGLGLHLLQFAETVEEACTNLLPNVLCDYLYKLSEFFTSFYTNCQVVGSAEETSRLLLCEATAVVMRKCFHLLGITPVEATPVKRLCKTQNTITVNGQFPGPTLQVRNGDHLVIKVVNRARYNVTLHWHGIRQLRTAWADGPVFVTQCPIRPGGSYTYRFTIEKQEGTLWWHAHSSWLRATVYGALVILPKAGSSYPFAQPKRELPILLGEWWNANPIDVVNQATRTGAAPNVSDAYTINGQPGDLYKCSRKDTLIFPVESGETNLLRVINSALNQQLFFTVANHKFTVVATDASYVKPFTTSVIMLGPGQTTDVLITTNQPVGRYYMAGRAYASAQNVPFDNTTTTAILEYKSAYVNPKTKARSNSPRPVFPFLPAYNDTPTVTAFTTRLRSSFQTPAVPTLIDEHLFFTVGLGLNPCRSRRPGRNCQGPNGTRFTASMNNVSFVLPSSFSILQAFYQRVNGVFTENFPPFPPTQFNYTGNVSRALWTPIPGTETFRLRFGSTVQIVLQDTNIFAAENHPIHLHGYSFHIIAEGFGNFNPKTDQAKFNLVDPPRRNTVGVPVGGWAVIRFVADNPGAWLMHCHIDSHLTWGLAMVFLVDNGVGKLQSLEPPPADLPQC